MENERGKGGIEEEGVEVGRKIGEEKERGRTYIYPFIFFLWFIGLLVE